MVYVYDFLGDHIHFWASGLVGLWSSKHMQKDPKFCKTKEEEIFSLLVPFFFPHNIPYPMVSFIMK
jgi:hypothetical protein